MFYKRPKPAQIKAADEAMSALLPDAEKVYDIPAREFMVKWLSVFAPDMSVADAKAFCLPRLLYKNRIWHAFSFRKTDCVYGEDADEAAAGKLRGEGYILMCDAQAVYRAYDLSVLTVEDIKKLKSAVVFDSEYKMTYAVCDEEGCGPFFKLSECAACGGCGGCGISDCEKRADAVENDDTGDNEANESHEEAEAAEKTSNE